MAALGDIDKFIKWDPAYKLYRPVFWRRNMLPSWLTFEEADAILPFTIAAAGTPTRAVTVEQKYSSVEGLDANLGTPFLTESLVYEDSTDGTAAADWTIRLREVGEVREFMNRENHVRCIAGTAQQPAIFREPYMFLSQHNVSVQLAKVAGGATNIRMGYWGMQYYPWDPEFLARPDQKAEIVSRLKKWVNRRKYVTPYWLTTDVPVSLAGNGTGDFRCKLGNDAQFEAYGVCAVSTGNFEMIVSEVKTKQTIMNGAITRDNGIGDARFPMIFPEPYLIPAGCYLEVTLTDLSGAPNDIFLTFFGRKIFAPIRDAIKVERETRVVVPTMADEPTPTV
jgi:hypothetical protein